MVNVTGTPGAVVVEPMKLDRMSLRVTPETVRTFEVAPDEVLVPSAG
jgi:hypothetical protein